VLADDTFAHSFLEEAPILPGVQTRPNLKIQEGCSNRCSFCVIPQTRGNSRSLAAQSILSHVRSFIAPNGNELVLSGINLGRWGHDLEGTGFSPYITVEASNRALSHEGNSPRTLAALVRAILEQTSLPRLRLSSIEPMDWNADLIALMAEYGGTKLARHAHLPLQSGSDSVLRRMHRRYRPWHYVEKVEQLIRAAGSALTLGADVMVGFPGETDEEFERSREFIAALPFTYLHVFTYSARPGTAAAGAGAQVPMEIRRDRNRILRDLAAAKNLVFRQSMVGKKLSVVTLNPPGAAISDNYLEVELAAPEPANQIVEVEIGSITESGLRELAKAPAVLRVLSTS
jgi:threonylcarbamoyladenosine tRNA methylthiotransferase MtaB